MESSFKHVVVVEDTCSFIHSYILSCIFFLVYLCTYAVFPPLLLDQSIVSFSFCCICRTISCTELFIYLFIYFLSSVFTVIFLLIGKIVLFATKAKHDFGSIKYLWECTTYSPSLMNFTESINKNLLLIACSH